MDYALFILDSDGIVKTFRTGNHLGYEVDEIEGESFSRLYTEAARQDEPLEKSLEKVDAEGRVQIQKVIVRKDGSEFEAQLNFEPVGREGGAADYIVIMKDRDQDKNLDDFSSLVAHELRNSLSVAQGYLEMARNTHDKQDFDEVERAQQNMIETITDLVMVTKNGEVEKHEINLKDVFEEAYRYSDHSQTSYEVEDVTIEAGRSSLMRLLGNLVSNSVEHNEGQIHIEVGVLDGGKGFYYQDNGKGIIDENREKALERGYSTDEDNGQGLGLFLMTQLADLNGWNVKLKQSEEGGARFEIYTEDAEN